MQSFRRLLAALACLVVGVASFALSYVALSDVAVRVAAVPAGLGWLVPIVIDGGVICGSAIIWSLSTESTRRPAFPFLFVGALVLVSVVVNIAHAGPTPLAKGIAALPPLILLGTLELVASQGRRIAEATRAADEAATAARKKEELEAQRRSESALERAQALAAAEREAADAVAERLAAERTLFVPAPALSIDVPAQRSPLSSSSLEDISVSSESAAVDAVISSDSTPVATEVAAEAAPVKKASRPRSTTSRATKAPASRVKKEAVAVPDSGEALAPITTTRSRSSAPRATTRTPRVRAEAPATA